MSNLATTPNVEMVHGHPVVLSVQVAKHFEKDHHRVLKDIRRLLADLPDNAREGYFAASEYTRTTGIGATRSYPAFHLSRDGFTLLAMGFTGKKAMQWKVRYIQAFSAMEKQLGNATPPTPSLPLSTTAQRKPLREAVYIWCKRSGMGCSEAWLAVKHRFNIARLDHLPEAWLDDALVFVAEQTQKHPAIPKVPKALALPATSVDMLRINQLPNKVYDLMRETMVRVEAMAHEQHRLISDAFPSHNHYTAHFVGDSQTACARQIESASAALQGLVNTMRSREMALRMVTR